MPLMTVMTQRQRRVTGPAAVLASGLAGVLLAACAGSGPDRDPATGGTPSPTVTATAATPGADRAYREVEFAAPDGERRSGRRYGEGDASVAVVLSHMGRRGDGPDDWAAFAEALADRGYQALTYPRRDADSQGWRDVLGAVDYLRRDGATTVIVAGASLGAMASLYAAGQPAAEIDGVAWLAGVRANSGYRFEEADVSGLGCPLLFISGDQDSYGAAEDSRQLHEWARESELLLLESRRHGTDIFDDGDANATQLTQAMLDFVDRVAGEPASPC